MQVWQILLSLGLKEKTSILFVFFDDFEEKQNQISKSDHTEKELLRKTSLRTYLNLSLWDWLPSTVIGSAMQNFLGLECSQSSTWAASFSAQEFIFPLLTGELPRYTQYSVVLSFPSLYWIILKLIFNSDHFHN